MWVRQSLQTFVMTDSNMDVLQLWSAATAKAERPYSKRAKPTSGHRRGVSICQVPGCGDEAGTALVHLNADVIGASGHLASIRWFSSLSIRSWTFWHEQRFSSTLSSRLRKSSAGSHEARRCRDHQKAKSSPRSEQVRVAFLAGV